MQRTALTRLGELVSTDRAALDALLDEVWLGHVGMIRSDAALDVITDRLLPGRVAELRRPTAKELAATMVLALPIEEWSLKISADWPEDPPEDIAGDAWAGVVEIGTWHGDASPAPDLRPGIAVPGSVAGLRNRRQSASDHSAGTSG